MTAVTQTALDFDAISASLVDRNEEWRLMLTRLIRAQSYERTWTVYELLDEVGMPEPVNAKAVIGGVTAALHKAGEIVRAGAVTTSRPGGHGSLVRLWQRAHVPLRSVTP